MCDKQVGGFDHLRLLTNVDDEGRNVLHYAVLQFKDPNLLKLLLGTFTSLDSQIFEGMILNGDSKGRNALEYALMFKREEVVRVLFPPTVKQMIARFNHASQDLLIKIGQPRYLEIMKQHLTIKRLDMLAWLMNLQTSEFFCSLLRACLTEGFEQCVEWLLDGPWKLLERLPQAIANEAKFVKELLVHTLQWTHPRYILYIKKSEIPLVRKKLRLGMYSLLEKWDGRSSSPAEIVTGLISDPGFDVSSVKLLRQQNDPIFAKLSDKALHNLFIVFLNEFTMKFNVLGVGKRSIYEALVLKADVLQDTKIPLQLFIQHEQPLLLNWYVKRYQIDLQAPLSSDAELLRFAQEQSWTHNADGEFQSDLSIDQFLRCLIFAGDFVVSFASFNFATKGNLDITYNGMNMVDLATVSGSYIVLKTTKNLSLWKQPEGAPRWKLCVSVSIDAFHTALKRNHRHVVEYLLPSFANDNVSTSRGDFTTAYYARNTTIPSLKNYTAEKLEEQRWRDLGDLILNETISAKSLQQFLVSYDFLSAPADVVVFLLKSSVQRGRIDVCAYFCDICVASNSSVSQGRDLISQLRDVSVYIIYHFSATSKRAIGSKIRRYIHYFIAKFKASTPQKAVIVLQSCVRRHLVQRRYRYYLGENYPVWLRFRHDWCVVVDRLMAADVRERASTWLQIKNLCHMIATEQDEDAKHQFEALPEATI
eukprot:gene33734-41618_t